MKPSALEKDFFLRYVIELLYIQNPHIDELLRPSDLVVTNLIATNRSDFDTGVGIAVDRRSTLYTKDIMVSYNRFNLKDYKDKKEDEYLLVPAQKVQNKAQLLNYMNDLYVNSVNIRKRVKSNGLFNNKIFDSIYGEQMKIIEENLQSFDLSYPAPDNILYIAAAEDSFLFTGSLRIKFV